MKLIVGLLNTKQGNIICHTKSIGYVPEKHYPIEYMSVKTFLKQLCIIRKMSLNECVNKINELSILWNLPLEKQLHKLSKGNLQKVFLVQAMIHNPDLYLFDEPLSGLDDQYQSFFLEQIKLKKLQEKTIIITTHYPKYYEYYDILLHMKEGHLYEENVTIPC